MTSVIPLAVGGHEFLLGDNLPMGHELVTALEWPDFTQQEKQQEVAMHVGALRAACADLLLHQDEEQEAAVKEGISTTFFRVCRSMHSLLPTPEAREDLVDWLSEATDKEVINFCQKSVVSHRKRQQKLDSLVPELQQQAKTWVGGLIEAGIYPSVAQERYAASFEEYSWIAGDPIDTAGDYGYETTFDALCNFEDKKLVALCDYPRTYNIWRYIYLHEQTHAAVAVEGPGFPIASRSGLRLVEETFVSHVVQVAGSNMAMPDTFAPSLRKDRFAGPYEPERALFAAINAACKKPVTLAELSQAAFSPKGLQSTVQRSVMGRLNGATKKLFPQWREAGIHGLTYMYAHYGDHGDIQYKKVSEWAAHACQQVGIEYVPE